MFLLFLTTILLALALIVLSKEYWDVRKSLNKYKPILDIETEIVSKSSEKLNLEQQLIKLASQCDSLSKELAALTDSNNLIEAGFYKSKYDFDDSKKYEERLEIIREKQKQMIKEKTAITCSTQWNVGGSIAEGKKMTERTIKLGLSAFNVQCDNEILKVKFNNIDRASEKISKIQEVVNKLLEPNHCTVEPSFVRLKLEELYLAYEFQQKVQAEKEEQKALREQQRDEEKARREAERAEAEAEREEKRYGSALEKAKLELEDKSEEQRALYQSKIAELEFKLKEAQENKERAKSMAEQTKMGHVYIISNIGSFGENVFKIGMTRRLDPIDRVDELSDASVPFEFDIHALIKSDDAPKLEKTLHQRFSNRRMNLVNERKEFFRVTIAELEEECKKTHGGDFRLTLMAEAKEYRQTIAMLSVEKKSA